jgi:hypothetical protein
MPSWRNITARVRIGPMPSDPGDEDNSKELPEYLIESSDDDDGVPCVSCWVPSIANEVRMYLVGSFSRKLTVLMRELAVCTMVEGRNSPPQREQG